MPAAREGMGVLVVPIVLMLVAAVLLAPTGHRIVSAMPVQGASESGTMPG